MIGRRRAVTCAPARRADRGWRSRRSHRIRPTAQALCEVEPTGEHRIPVQQGLLRVVEQVIGPLHGVAQCVMVFRPAPGADQQPKPLIESITHLGYRHRRHPGSRQLDGQRDTVESSADLHHRIRLIDHREARSDGPRAFDEQLHRSRTGPRHDIQRRHRPHLLVAHPKSFAAGRENRHGGRLCEDRVNEIGGGVKHVLAVVEHQQPDPALQRSSHRLAHGLAGLLGDAQHRRHRVGHRCRISDRREFENPDPACIPPTEWPA